MKRTLIVGCGYVGSVLATELVADRQEVFALRRSESELPAGVGRITADVSSPIDAALLPDPLDAVVYTVAAKSRDESSYRAAYDDGLAHVLEALSRKARWPRRILFASSTAVYGQASGEWVDEDSPTFPSGFSGRIMLDAERRLGECPAETVAFRLGGIYGPGRTSRLESVALGRAAVSAGPPHYTNRIHRDDAALAMRHLIGLDSPARCYLGVDDDPADQRSVIEWMAQVQGAPVPRVVAEGEAAPARAGSKRCRNDLLRRSGYEFRYPTYRDGYSALLDAPSGPSS